jgi:hypothetical protein
LPIMLSSLPNLVNLDLSQNSIWGRYALVVYVWVF